MNAQNDMTQLIANCYLDRAFTWLCEHRATCLLKIDIARNWPEYKAALRQRLLSGCYQLSPLDVVPIGSGTAQGGTIGRWQSNDALLIKALTLWLQDKLRTRWHKNCYHVAGHGGLKGAVRKVHEALPAYRFCFKTDIASYYYSMDHAYVMQGFAKYIKDKRILALIYQCLNRVEIYRAEHKLVDKGICKGCSLSPLIASLYLFELGAEIAKSENKQRIAYVRYMDDFVVLAKTRHHLRQVIKTTYHLLERMKLKLARDKTFIGAVTRGFDFLGYRFEKNNEKKISVSVSKTCQARMQQKVARLYEQCASNGRIERYLQHWLTWVKGGLSGVIDTALKSIKTIIHNMCEVVNVAKGNRLSVMAFSALIA